MVELVEDTRSRRRKKSDTLTFRYNIFCTYLDHRISKDAFEHNACTLAPPKKIDFASRRRHILVFRS